MAETNGVSTDAAANTAPAADTAANSGESAAKADAGATHLT